MTENWYKDLLIKRIKEERKVLADMLREYNKGNTNILQNMDNQFGYVAGLEHALRLLGE